VSQFRGLYRRMVGYHSQSIISKIMVFESKKNHVLPLDLKNDNKRSHMRCLLSFQVIPLLRIVIRILENLINFIMEAFNKNFIFSYVFNITKKRSSENLLKDHLFKESQKALVSPLSS